MPGPVAPSSLVHYPDSPQSYTEVANAEANVRHLGY